MTDKAPTSCCGSRKQTVILAFGWLVLILAAAGFRVAEDLRASFNSDVYYLPVLVKDITQMGGSFSEWRLTPAPYLFPDMLFYLLSYIIVRGPIPALVLSGALQYFVFIAGWFLIARRFAKNENSAFAAGIAVLVLGALGMSLQSLRFAAYWSTHITMHFGVICMAPWCILLADICLSSARRSSRIISAAGVFLIIWGITLSDMLSVTQITIPLICAAVLLFIANRTRAANAAVLCAVITAGAALGSITMQWIGRGAAHAYIQPDFIRSADSARAFLRWIKSFMEHQSFAAALSLICLFFYIVLVLTELARAARTKRVDAQRLLLASFIAAAVPLNITAVLIMGNFFSSGDARYTLSLMFYPIFATPVLLAGIDLPRSLKQRILPAALLALAVTAALNAGYTVKLNRLARYADYYPEWISWVDSETSQRGVSAGVSSYWDAKEIILLSKKNLRMVQSTSYLVPYNWISNTKWFDRFEPRFFLCSNDPVKTDMVQEKDVVSTFGKPEALIRNESRSLLFYPSGSLITHWFRNHPMREEFHAPGDSASFKASGLPGDIGRDSGPLRIAEPPSRAGSLTLGPYIMMPAGKYRAEILYSAAPGPDYVSSGYWQLRTVKRLEPALLQEEALKPGTDKTAVIEFSLDRRSAVELLTSYTGSGRLEVQSISFTRLL